MLSVEGLVSRYGRIEALHGVSLRVAQGEVVALVGANGGGKTTLLRALSGVQPVAAGLIEFAGAAIGHVPAHRRVRLGISQVPEGRQVFAPLTVEENLLVGAWTRRSEAAAGLEMVYGLFPVLAEFRRRPAGALSGGQQQMLAMGRALVARPRLLLMDEPSMGLAPLMIEQIFAIVAALPAQGVTVLLVEQNVQAALTVAHRGYVIETGSITLEGTGAGLRADPRVRAAFLGL